MHIATGQSTCILTLTPTLGVGALAGILAEGQAEVEAEGDSEEDADGDANGEAEGQAGGVDLVTRMSAAPSPAEVRIVRDCATLR